MNTNDLQEKRPQFLGCLRSLGICSQPSFSSFTFSHFLAHRAEMTNMPLTFNNKHLLGAHFSTFSQQLNSTLKPSSQVTFSGGPDPTCWESAHFFPIPPWHDRHISIKALVTFHCEYLLMCLFSNPILEGCTSLYLWCSEKQYG